jgi:uncharacterized membrane protein YqaE (UPF0057 family)
MILFLCYVFPPLAVLLMGRPFSAIGNMFATLFGWMPGVRHALVCYADYKVDKGIGKITGAINRPKYITEGSQRQKPARSRVKQVYTETYDAPNIGRNGTQFRRK